MTTQTEVLKMALEALEKERPYLGAMPTLTAKAITAIKEALAQPEQEPVAHIPLKALEQIKPPMLILNNVPIYGYGAEGTVAIYTTPPQRTWIGLDDDEMLMIYGQQHEGKKYSLGRMVEAKLKAKNKRLEKNT